MLDLVERQRLARDGPGGDVPDLPLDAVGDAVLDRRRKATSVSDRAADVLGAQDVVGVDVEGALGVRRPGFDRIRRDLRDGLDERGEAVLGRELSLESCKTRKIVGVARSESARSIKVVEYSLVPQYAKRAIQCQKEETKINPGAC